MIGRADGGDVAVASRPVRAAQARVGQAHKGAEHDQVQGQEPGHEDQFAVTSLDAVSHFRQPICELWSSFCISERTERGSASGGIFIMRWNSETVIQIGPRNTPSR